MVCTSLSTGKMEWSVTIEMQHTVLYTSLSHSPELAEISHSHYMLR